MRRRSFLVGAAGAAAAAWPAWLARAFDPESGCDAGERRQALFDGYRAARRAGKPLLVLIVPEDDRAKWDRGAAFGEVLNHGDDETLAALALVTLACATRDELGRLVAIEAEVAAEEPLFATVGTASRPAQLRTYRVDLPNPREELEDIMLVNWNERQALETRLVDERIAALGAALRAAVAEANPGAPSEVSYDAERLARAIARGDEVESADVLHAARALHARAAARADQRSKLIAALATAVRREIVSQPIAGSLWARSGGCGTGIEGREAEGYAVACGMGHVPEKSQRFLYFFTRLPWEH